MVYGSVLLALRVGGSPWVGVDFPQKKHYVIIEWPIREPSMRNVLKKHTEHQFHSFEFSMTAANYVQTSG